MEGRLTNTSLESKQKDKNRMKIYKQRKRREEGGASCGKTAENNRTDNCKRRMRGRIEERRGCLVVKLS